jgi:hypothetical protein
MSAQFIELQLAEMCIFIDDHVAAASRDWMLPIGRLLIVLGAMMAPIIRVDKGPS